MTKGMESLKHDYLSMIDELKIVGERKKRLTKFVEGFIKIVDDDKLKEEQFVTATLDLITPIILDEENFYIDYYLIFVIGDLTDLGVVVTANLEGFSVSLKLPEYKDENETECDGDCENCNNNHSDNVKTLIHSPLSGCFGGNGEGEA